MYKLYMHYVVYIGYLSRGANRNVHTIYVKVLDKITHSSTVKSEARPPVPLLAPCFRVLGSDSIASIA